MFGDHAGGFPLLQEVFKERFRDNSWNAGFVQIHNVFVGLDSIDGLAAHPISPEGLYEGAEAQIIENDRNILDWNILQ